jgi:hypothetical protein
VPSAADAPFNPCVPALHARMPLRLHAAVSSKRRRAALHGHVLWLILNGVNGKLSLARFYDFLMTFFLVVRRYQELIAQLQSKETSDTAHIAKRIQR